MKRTEWIVSVADEGEIGVIELANWMQELVRCKDCKHYMTMHCTCGGCYISDDWFCADGERR